MGFAQDILDRRRGKPAPVEKRAEWGSSAIPGPLAMGSGGSYANVNLAGLESNFQQVAIWSAIDLIASLAAQLPLDTYKRTSADAQARNIGNPRVIEDPGGDGHGSEDWVYQYLVSKLGRGNAIGKQVIDPNTGYPTQTVLYHPDTVRGERDRITGRARWWVDGREVDKSEIWHRRSYPMPGCLMGLSPLQVHMTSIQLGIASGRFGAQFFTDSAIPSALLTNEEAEIDQPQATEVKARWMSAIWGTREPAVFGKGWKYQQLSLAPDESQFLETNKYSQAQCARIYGPNVAEILGYETGGTMDYANVVDRSIDLLKYVLNRWLRDVEKTMTLWLPRGQFVKVNRKAILETDILSRFKAYQIGVNSKFLPPSEIRETEDLPPLTAAQKKELESMPAAKPQPDNTDPEGEPK